MSGKIKKSNLNSSNAKIKGKKGGGNMINSQLLDSMDFSDVNQSGYGGPD